MPVNAHSTVVGSSTAKRVLECPASIDLAAKAPAPLESSYAAEGTALHMAVEHILHHDCEPEAVVGLTFAGLEITDDLLHECVLPCIEAADAFIGTRPFYIERRFAFPGIAGAFGTGDLIVLNEDGALYGVGDWKFGAGVAVTAKGNAQAKFLACGAAAALGMGETVKVMFCQPRLGGVTEDTFTRADLDLFETELLHAVNSRRDEIKQGDHCRFCPAKLICPAQHQMLADLEKRMLVAKELPELLARAERVSELVKAAQDMARDLLEAGTPVAGLKLIEGKALPRAFRDDDTARRVCREHGVSSVTEPKPLTVAEVERRITKAQKKKFAFEEGNPALKPRQIGKPSVVAETHPAPALAVKGAPRAKLAALAERSKGK